MSEDGDSISKKNLSGVVNIGLVLNLSQKGNELLGAYTEDRLRQRKIETAMTGVKYAIGLAINPIVGGIYVAGDLAYRGIQYNVKLQKWNREANYYNRLSGNTANSGSRYRGGYS